MCVELKCDYEDDEYDEAMSTLLQKPTLEEKMVMRSGTSAVD